MSSRTIATPTHIGKDVPDALAFIALLKRLDDGSKVNPATGCWEWTGYRSPNGYGITSFRGRGRPVHRLLYMIKHGPIPPGMDVMHKCDNPPCLNPKHLELGTRRQNIRDSVARNRHHLASKTHCKRGHAFTPENTNFDAATNTRHCKTCGRARHRIKAGWPEDLAYSVPAGAVGYRPDGIPYGEPKGNNGRYKVETPTCPHGHAIAGDNVYTNPDGYRKCRRCRTDAAMRFRPKPVGSEIDGEGKL